MNRDRTPGTGPDIARSIVGVSTTNSEHPVLPKTACLPINHCNLPAVILGSLTYQRHPTPLTLDGVLEIHRALFVRLDIEDEPRARAHLFMSHMNAVFSLVHPEEAGWAQHSRLARSKAHYVRLIRGWAFDADGLEAAALKGWVESRFGLLPRHHGGPIRDYDGTTYRHYTQMRARGLYATNALEAQLDLLYTYCQYELRRQHPEKMHITLYRGINRMDDYEYQEENGTNTSIVLLNNISSFTRNRERAGEFGDYIFEVEIPFSKVFFFHGLLPRMFKGEDEYVVIGGLYEAAITS